MARITDCAKICSPSSWANWGTAGIDIDRPAPGAGDRHVAKAGSRK